MDLLLTLAALNDLLNTAGVIGITALALGFVIFVHELGHFAVAKLCGVRCDKFFVGFDVGGYKISKQIGETEYGIGILPLGGYVKMFGQDDNVANLAEQMEQSKKLEGSPEAKEIIGPSGDKIWVDRRSYLAKSVPQRMAIISAGVVMNVIFAFIFAWIAFGIGVPKAPAQVGQAIAGGAAWQAGLRTGDRIVELNGIESPTFQQLIQQVILVDDPEAGLPMKVSRGGSEPRDVVVRPERTELAPRIKITPPLTAKLSAKSPVRENGAAAKATGDGFEPNDQITAVNDEPVESYADLAALLMKYQSESVTYTLQREDGSTAKTTVPPNVMETLGVRTGLGPVVSVQQGSPAEEAGIEPGDQLLSVNDLSIGADTADGAAGVDPMQLDNRIAELSTSAGDEVMLTLVRAGESDPTTLSVTPRKVRWPVSMADAGPISLESLGVACGVTASIVGIDSESPAADADLKVGDEIKKVTLRSADREADRWKQETIVLDFASGDAAWPAVVQYVQDTVPGLSVELVVERDGETVKTDLSPAPSPDSHWPMRGIQIQPLKETHRAGSLGEQTRLAWEETTSQMTGIFRLLQKLGGQVSVKALGGPVMIAEITGRSAFEGWGPLLMTLTLFSANLAVLNFLPIPVLDGGHMVFLAYEGITGRPPNERILVALHIVGLVFLLGLMAMVFTLDISRLLGVQL